MDATFNVLLTRRGLVSLPSPHGGATIREVEAVLLEFVALGYVGSQRLRDDLAALSTKQLAEVRELALTVLAAKRGANQAHKPLFRRFPRGIPRDTAALWWKRVLSAYLQTPEQPCLHCHRDGTTHVLRPCEHVVCEYCYDGANYSACPICNRQVDRTSPFFKPDEAREAPVEKVRFELLTSVHDPDPVVRELIDNFCARTQALNPTDKADFLALLQVRDGAKLLEQLPAQIPLKENLALVFARLFRACPPVIALDKARTYLRNATDVLRVIASYSNADPALQGDTIYEKREQYYRDTPWYVEWAKNFPDYAKRYENQSFTAHIPHLVQRFPMAKISRPLRRAWMQLLEEFDEHTLTEDMLRHRSYWVWVGEFLHPAEYAKRYPKLARAFQVVRKFDPKGVRAPTFHGFAGQVEIAAARADVPALLDLLGRRPGEFARRLDHVLRLAGDDTDAAARVIETFRAHLGTYSLPVLLTLYALLPTRVARARRRMFWPKGGVALGVTISDRRPTLRREHVDALSDSIELELLRRFGERPHFATALVDQKLEDIVAPFNERTASPSAVNLPRGSTIHVPPSKVVRLFLHWCEPPDGERTDIDLSIGFYDRDWNYVGVCSYYQLQFTHEGKTVAVSSGDLTSAPYPDGASEFVDLYREEARGSGIRYAVMVVNAYAGLPFSKLERGFAGAMLRDDAGGHHFDPRTVALKFALQGDNGVYTPLCLDLDTDTLHWLDIYAKGEMAMNNVDSSTRAITRVCPETIEYFASHVRLDMLQLGLLHAASRCKRVLLRSDAGVYVYERNAGETAQAFLRRLEAGTATTAVPEVPELGTSPVFAVLHRGDVELPAESSVYALFREQLHPNLDAADLIT
jgi:hypothetical protein